MDVSSRSDTKPTTTRKTRRTFLGLALALTASSLPAIATVSNPAATPHSVEAAARRRRKPKRRQQRQRRPKFKVVTRTFSNPEAVGIPSLGRSGPATRYPSAIVVNGLRGGQIEKVTVSMRIAYPKPEDLDILLVGPNNTGVVLMSDAGGTTGGGVDLTFDQDAPGVLPDVLVSGVYQPSNYPVALDAFPAPAPGGISGHSLTAFNGENPNGEWQLFINDDEDSVQDGGGALGGWSITIRARIRVR